MREAGFVAVVAKPIDAASWQAAVRRALDATSSERAATPVGASGGKLPVWDDDAALVALNGNGEHVAALRRLFLDELPGMRTGIADPENRAATLHRLRASCGFVGAARLDVAVQALQESKSEIALQRVLDTLQDTLDQAPSR